MLPSRRSPFVTSADRPGTRKRAEDAAKSVRPTPSELQRSSTVPLMSKKSVATAGDDQCVSVRSPVQASATARRSPWWVNRLPDSNRRTSLRPRRRLCEHESSSPGSSEGRRTVNFSESGLAIAAGSIPGAQNGSAAARSMNANVIDSEKPAAVITRRIVASRWIRTSGAGCGASRLGNVTGIRSKP